MESSQNEKIYNRFTTHFAYMLAWCFLFVISRFTVCKQTLCKYVGKLCLHTVFSCANGWSSFRKEQLFLLLKAY